MGGRARWTEEDNAKLMSLAGTMPPAEVAAKLERTIGATVVQASKLKVSLAYNRRRVIHYQAVDGS